MKRLLTYLFLILGLGMVVNVETNAKVVEVCEQRISNGHSFIKYFSNIEQYENRVHSFTGMEQAVWDSLNICSVVIKSKNEKLYDYIYKKSRRWYNDTSGTNYGSYFTHFIQSKKFKKIYSKYPQSVIITGKEKTQQIAKKESTQNQQVENDKIIVICRTNPDYVKLFRYDNLKDFRNSNENKDRCNKIVEKSKNLKFYNKLTSKIFVGNSRSLDINTYISITKLYGETTQIAKVEPTQTQQVAKENKEVSDTKKLNLTYKAYTVQKTNANSVAILFLDKGKCKYGSSVVSIFKSYNYKGDWETPCKWRHGGTNDEIVNVSIGKGSSERKIRIKKDINDKIYATSIRPSNDRINKTIETEQNHIIQLAKKYNVNELLLKIDKKQKTKLAKIEPTQTKKVAKKKTGIFWKKKKTEKKKVAKKEKKKTKKVAKKEPSQTQQVAKYSYDKDFICFQNLNGTIFIGNSKAGWVTTTDNIENLCDYFVYKDYHPKEYRKIFEWEGKSLRKGIKYPVNDMINKFKKKKYSKVLHSKIILEQTLIAKKESAQTQQVAKKETYYCVSNDASLLEQYFSSSARCPTKYKSVSANEYASLKKQVKPTQTKQVADDKSDLDKIIKKLFAKHKKKIKMEDMVTLGTYQEFNSYPDGMLKEFGSCKKQFCRGIKAGKKVYEYFAKRGPLWHKRHPGDIIHGMAWFEIFYLEKLRKNKDQIARYLENGPKGYKSKFKMQKDVNSLHGLINMNKGRKKMRDALGFSLDDDLELVLRQEWLLGEFLNHDEYKVKRVSLNKELLKRKDLLARYQTSLKKYKEKLSEERDGG